MSKTLRTTLADLGEFRIISEVILPLARRADASTQAGDDCAFIQAGGETLAVTADVGPRPLIRSLAAHSDDWEASGWMAVLATASDVASAGARPLFLSNCIDAPADLEVGVLARFMDGYFRAMSEFGFKNGGGDLRHGPTLAARVFGVGMLESPRRIGRSGARPGDRLVVIGPVGSYMSRYLLAAERETSGAQSGKAEDAEESFRFPKPQIRAMRVLAKHGLIQAASDTSDGLIGAIENIAQASACSFALELDESLLTDEILAASRLPRVASPWNLFFAWGDWSVAAVVDCAKVQEFESICRDNDLDWRPLGWATENEPALRATLDNCRMTLMSVRNENFVSRGFNAGLEAHLQYILQTPVLA